MILPRTALAVVLGCATALATFSCNERKAKPSHDQSPASTSSSLARPHEGSIKISLVPPQGRPVELQIGVTPFPDSEAWVEPTATLMHSALVECGPISSITDIALSLRQGALRPPPEAVNATGPGKCLYEFLKGKELQAAGAQARELLIRFVPESPPGQ
jgi:hypothetical protein